mmetsp:Transcript_11044/g.47749  ORF Transcript_11044/g.47749 Transcript_11044/m.47749 type:complete len:459 (-) Transcript_11044:569-1945(-)
MLSREKSRTSSVAWRRSSGTSWRAGTTPRPRMRTPRRRRRTPRLPARRRYPQRRQRLEPPNSSRTRLRNFVADSQPSKVEAGTWGRPGRLKRSHRGRRTRSPDPERRTASHLRRSIPPNPRCAARSKGSPPRKRLRRRRRWAFPPRDPRPPPRWPRLKPRRRGRGSPRSTRRPNSESSWVILRSNPSRTSPRRCPSGATTPTPSRSLPPRIGNSPRSSPRSARSSNARNRVVSRFARTRCGRASRARRIARLTPSPSRRKGRRRDDGKSPWSRSSCACVRLRTRRRSGTRSRRRSCGVSTRWVPRGRWPRGCPTCTARWTPCFARRASGWNERRGSWRRGNSPRGARDRGSSPRGRSRLLRSTGISGSSREGSARSRGPPRPVPSPPPSAFLVRWGRRTPRSWSRSSPCGTWYARFRPSSGACRRGLTPWTKGPPARVARSKTSTARRCPKCALTSRL